MFMIAIHTSSSIKAQDLEQIPDSLYLKTTGGINIGLTAYNSNGMNNRRDPFSYLLSANLTFNISDVISMPFSASFSSGSQTYSQPRFAMAGISPKYKYLTVHAGHRSMQFSPYTLSGIMFLGGGVEIDQKEKFWQLKLMGGRLAKGIAYNNQITGQIEQPSFQRMGWGGMLTIGNDNYAADFIAFKAGDDFNSIYIPDTANIAPQENLTVGINTRFKLFNNIKISTEYAGSAYTSDTRMDEIIYDKYTYLNNLGGLYTPRLSSAYSSAIGISASYAGETFSVGGSYKRVDPDYITLGSTYISNDFRNITLNASKSLINNKITLSGSFGNQKNNLEGDKEQNTKRIIGSLQGAFIINEHIIINGNYSNFSTSTTPSYIYLGDSVKYIQVAKNYGGMISYSIPGEIMSHNLMLNITMQTSDMLNNNATEVINSNTVSKNYLLTYTTNYQPLMLSINTSLNITQFQMQNGRTQAIGPVISFSRPFLNRKINSSLAFSYISSKVGENNNNTSVVRLNLNWKVFPKHTIKFNAGTTFMGRMVKENQNPEWERKKSNETRLVINYNMSF